MVAILNRVVSESLPVKGAFDQRPESREDVCQRDLEDSRQRKSRCKDPEVGVFLLTWGKAVVATFSLVLL